MADAGPSVGHNHQHPPASNHQPFNQQVPSAPNQQAPSVPNLQPIILPSTGFQQKGVGTGTLIPEKETTAGIAPIHSNHNLWNPKAPTFASLLKGTPLPPQASPRTQKKSFDSIFTSETDIQVKQPTIHRGKLSVLFSDEEISKLASHYTYAIVGKFSRKIPEFRTIKPGLTKLGFRGDFTVGALRPGYVLLNFQLEEDFTRLWLKPEWQVAGWPMRIFKWSPSFTFETESTLAAVWVAFPELPPHLFSKSSLYSIASLIGKPLKLDEPTADRTRPSVARVCVEIDLLKSYDQELLVGCGSLGGFPLNFLFENRPPYCNHCWKRGHDNSQCKVSQQKEKGKEKGTGPSYRETVQPSKHQNGKEAAGPSNRAEAQSLNQPHNQTLQQKGVFARLGPLGGKKSLPGNGQKEMEGKEILKSSDAETSSVLAEKGNNRTEMLAVGQDKGEKEASFVNCLNPSSQNPSFTVKDISTPHVLDKNNPKPHAAQSKKNPTVEGSPVMSNQFSILEHQAEDLEKNELPSPERDREEDEGVLVLSGARCDQVTKDKSIPIKDRFLQETEGLSLQFKRTVFSEGKRN